jgi:hypothetical protein
MLPFRFEDADVSAALVVDVPSGIETKEALFAELAERLRFPDYFGANWDALWECIRDLSWLPGGPIVLRHHDLPLAADIASLKKYLSILGDTVEKKWTVPGQRLCDLVVVFPAEARDQIAWLLSSADHDEKR